jgi:23S rRNA pseudouridine1911/1915/1917 synthase
LRQSDLTGELRKNGATGDEVLLARQALHAHTLRFIHPITRAVVNFEAPLAGDIARTLDFLRSQPANRPQPAPPA